MGEERFRKKKDCVVKEIGLCRKRDRGVGRSGREFNAQKRRRLYNQEDS